MKTKILRSFVALLSLFTVTHVAMAQGTAFTYQGNLTDGDNPANGVYFLKAVVFDAAFNGNALTPALVATVHATNGLFTINLNPGPGVFTGEPRWLEFYMRSNLTSLFVTLSPRQLVSPTPYATFAAGANAAGITGTIPAANIANGTITANKLDADVGLWSASGAAVYRSGGGVGIGVTNPSAALHLNGGMKINGINTLEFGAGTAGKELSAGKIGYQVFTADALDIIGAGTSVTNRQIKFWAEGGAQFTGPVTAHVFTIIGGSDVAEPYHVASTKGVEPIAGMVVSIDPDKVGQMRVACGAYDKTVAGILSGANGIAPGITLRQAGTIADGTLPVASIGRVWCYADADANGSIEAGDMLTTSDTAGYAMKVNDVDRANGSVIGKAMSPLTSGRGLVLVFVSLK